MQTAVHLSLPPPFRRPRTAANRTHTRLRCCSTTYEYVCHSRLPLVVLVLRLAGLPVFRRTSGRAHRDPTLPQSLHLRHHARGGSSNVADLTRRPEALCQRERAGPGDQMNVARVFTLAPGSPIQLIQSIRSTRFFVRCFHFELQCSAGSVMSRKKAKRFNRNPKLKEIVSSHTTCRPLPLPAGTTI